MAIDFNDPGFRDDLNRLYSYPVYSYSHSISTTTTYPASTDKPHRDAAYTTTKEKPMPDTKTIIRETAESLAEEAERARIEAAFAAWSPVLEDLDWDTVARFQWVPDEDHTYSYAALYTGGKWYLTGAQSPNGLTAIGFTAWLVEKGITPNDIEWL